MNQPNRDKDTETTEVTSDGLFGDTPPVKRENPYLRKNREKAAKAASETDTAVSDASASDTASSDKAPAKRENPYLRKNREKAVKAEKTHTAPQDIPADEDDEGGRRRTFSDFIFEHVKLITAIATCLVILSLVIITDVTGWVEDIKMKQEQRDKTPLTLAHVRALCDRGQNITWQDLTGYVRMDTDVTDDSVTWKFKVGKTGLKEADLELWISGVNTTREPTYVYLYDLMAGERIDLNKDNLDLFLDRLE